MAGDLQSFCIRVLTRKRDIDESLTTVIETLEEETGANRVFLCMRCEKCQHRETGTECYKIIHDTQPGSSNKPSTSHYSSLEFTNSLLAHDPFTWPKDNPRETIFPIFPGEEEWGCLSIEKIEIEEEFIKMVQSVADVMGMTLLHWRKQLELEVRVNFESITSGITSRCATSDPCNGIDAVITSLRDVVQFMGVDHAYLYEGRGKHILEYPTSSSENKEKIEEINELPWMKKPLSVGEIVHFSDVSHLPEEARVEREFYEKNGIRALCVLPLKLSWALTGWFALVVHEEVRNWSRRELNMLEQVEGIFGLTIERYYSEITRKNHEERISAINSCVLGLGVVFEENIQSLVDLCCRLTDSRICYYCGKKGELTYSSKVHVIDEKSTKKSIKLVLEEEGKKYTLILESNCVDIDSKTPVVQPKGEFVFTHYPLVDNLGFLCSVNFSSDGNSVGEVEETVSIISSAIRAEVKRKVADDSLAEETTERLLLLDSIQTQVWYLSTPHTYGAVNTAHAKFLGAEVNDISYKDLFDLVPHEVAEVCTMSNREAFESGKVQIIQEWAPDSSGEVRCLSIAKTPVYDEDGNIRSVVCSADDITSQVVAEKALRESEENFRTFIGSMMDMMFVLSLQGEILYMNQVAVDKLGYSLDELTSMPVIKVFCTGTNRRHVENVISSLLHGRCRRTSLPLETKNAGIFPVETHTWRGKWSGADCLFGICQDIRGEREAQLRFERMFRNNPSPMSLLSVEGVICDVNVAFLDVMGYSRDEVVGNAQQKLNIFADTSQGESWVHLVSERGRISGEEVMFRKKNGEVRNGLFSGDFVSSDGQMYVLTVVVDITELVRAQEKNMMQALVLDQIEEHVTVTDLNGRITYVNDGLTRGLGYTKDECIGKSPSIYRVSDRQVDVDIIVSDASNGNCVREEVLRHTSDGRIVSVWLRTQLVKDMKGNVVAVCGVGTDITERKRLENERQEMERQVQHTQKLESLGVLAGGIAHDFNNLLLSILGHAELVLDELCDDSSMRSSVEQIISASHTAADLCQQMLAYSGKGKTAIVPLDIPNEVNTMVQLLKTSISKKVTLSLELNEVKLVDGDGAQVRQVIMNLVINASEAIGMNNGTISIITGMEYCDSAMLKETVLDEKPSEGEFVSLVVEDSGCGMDEATIDKIFDPFFTTKFTGRGLGMSAVLGIVRSHRGALFVKSEVGFGTEFKVLLPVSVHSSESLITTDCGTRSGRILLADGEDGLVSGQLILERLGYEVTTAKDTEEVVHLFENEKFDGVILDEKIGEETIHELKDINPEIKVMLSSEQCPECYLDKFEEDDFLFTIQKPFTLSEFKRIPSFRRDSTSMNITSDEHADMKVIDLHRVVNVIVDTLTVSTGRDGRSVEILSTIPNRRCRRRKTTTELESPTHRRASVQEVLGAKNSFIWGNERKIELVIREIIGLAIEASLKSAKGLSSKLKGDANVIIRSENSSGALLCMRFTVMKGDELLSNFHPSRVIRKGIDEPSLKEEYVSIWIEYPGIFDEDDILFEVTNVLRSHNGLIFVDQRREDSSKMVLSLPVYEVTVPRPRGKKLTKGKSDFHLYGVRSPLNVNEMGKHAVKIDNANLLLVDDEMVLRKLGSRQLTKLGHRVVTAKDGIEGVELYEKSLQTGEERIDVVLMDMCMPRMGGYEAFQRIREMDRSARVVIVSGAQENDEVEGMLRQGAIGLLPKPYQKKQLSEAISLALRTTTDNI